MSRHPALLTLICIAPLAFAAGSNDPASELSGEQAKQALQLIHSPRSAAHLIRMHAYRDDVDDLSVIANTEAQFLERHGVDPLARTMARLLLLDIEKAKGRLHKAAELSRQLGFIHDFYVVGGFSNEGKSGCKTDFGPETGALNWKNTYPLKGRDAAWHKVTLKPYDGYVDLATLVRPNRESIAYAVTYLDAPQESRVNLAVGSSGAFRLWVNGQLAASDDRYHLPRPDQARVAVHLRKGLNRVMVKVCEDSGPFGFYLREESADAPLSVSVALPDKVPPLERGTPAAPQPLPTLATVLEHEAAKHPNDPKIRGEYATVLHSTREFEDQSHTDMVEAEHAADAAPKDIELRLLAADLRDDDPNLRRQHLDAALKIDPSWIPARFALAQHHLAHGHPEAALPLLQDLLAERPKFAAATLALGRAYEALGEWPRSARLIESAFAEQARFPNIVREASRVSRRLDRFQEAIDRLRVALALRYDDENSRRALAGILADLAHVPEAAEELALILKLDPFDNTSRLRLAELNASNERLTEAERLFAEAKAISPEEPDVQEREGRALLSAGRSAEALAAFERALVLRPQNPALREALRSLKGENASPASQYAVDVRTLVKEADKYLNEDAVYLVNYTYTRVQPSGLSSKFQQMAVKIYTQRAVESFRSYPITYSPDRQEVRVTRARITKPDGSVVESYGDNDRNINEPWSGMYYDARAKVLSFPALAAGDVLELQYRLEDTAQDNLLSDYWGNVDYIQNTAPTVRYQFYVDMPEGRPLYWNKSQLGVNVTHAEQKLKDGRVLYTWNANNVAKVVPEPNMPGWSEVASTLHVSTYKTWEDVGRYYWGLIRDQLTPDEELRKTVDHILANVNRKDPEAVMQAIYDYVVTNTRYVALEFGIHGYKPYRVDRILARRFGDCKDKASLMNAMLKIAGIDSELVLLRMRHLGALAAEPASLAAFNHAIVYVPKFDRFLDGTAEFHGSKELPSADHVANVLTIDPEGHSVYRTTPEANAIDNLTVLSLEVALNKDGSAEAKGDSTVTGETASDYRRAYQAASSRKQLFEQGWAQTFPGLTVKEITLTDSSKLEQDVTLKFKMQIPRYAESLTNVLRFYPLGSARQFTQTFTPLSERRFDLVMSGPFVNRFKYHYVLPAGYATRELPATVSEESPFGHLKMTYRQDEKGITCEAEFALSVARVKASDYAAFRNFLGRVDQAFARKIVVVGGSQTAQR